METGKPKYKHDPQLRLPDHVLESGLQKAVKTAVDRAGIMKIWAAAHSISK